MVFHWIQISRTLNVFNWASKPDYNLAGGAPTNASHGAYYPFHLISFYNVRKFEVLRLQGSPVSRSAHVGLANFGK